MASKSISILASFVFVILWWQLPCLVLSFCFILSQRASSAERQVESLREELLAAQNAAQVINLLGFFVLSLYSDKLFTKTIKLRNNVIIIIAFIDFNISSFLECKWWAAAKHGKIYFKTSFLF